MLVCPKCKRSYDDSWQRCLDCRIPLVKQDEALEEKDLSSKELPGSRSTIIIYSILIMIVTPLIVIIAYLAYLSAFDMAFVKHAREQLKHVIIFEKGKKEKKETKEN